MPLDVSGLRPIDTSGLQRFDTSGLTKLDVSGLTKVEQGDSPRRLRFDGGRETFESQQQRDQGDRAQAKRLARVAPEYAARREARATRVGEKEVAAEKERVENVAADREAWGPTLRNIPEQVRAAAAGTVSGMRAREFAALEKAPPLSPEFDGMSADDAAAARRGRTEGELAVAREAQAEQEKLSQVPRTTMQRAVGSAAQSLAISAPAMAVGIATRNPALAAGSMIPPTAGQSFGEYANYYADQAAAALPFGRAPRTEGQRTADLDRAAFHADIQGYVEAGTELLPFSKLFRPGATATTRFLSVLAAELPGESVATIAQSIDDVLARSPEGATMGEVLVGLQQGFSQLPDTWAATLIQSGVMSAVVSGADRIARPRRRDDPEQPGAPSANAIPDVYTPERVLALAAGRKADLESRDALQPAEQQELDFLRARGGDAQAVATAYELPMISEEDEASPIPTELIAQGRQRIVDAVSAPAETQPAAPAAPIQSSAPPAAERPATAPSQEGAGSATGGAEPIPGAARQPVAESFLDEQDDVVRDLPEPEPTVEDYIASDEFNEEAAILAGVEPEGRRSTQFESYRDWIESQPAEKLKSALTSSAFNEMQLDDRLADNETQELVDLWRARAAIGPSRQEMAAQPEQPAVSADTATSAPTPRAAVTIEPFTEKSIIVRGLGKDAASRFEGLKAKPLWNAREQAWVFSKKREDELRGALADLLAEPAAAVARGAELRGEKIDDEWVKFSPESGTLGIPRDDMPQIRAEHRGALTQFLKARGLDWTDETVSAASLKATQAEMSEAKIAKAKEFEGGDRAILVSSDNYVLDGHHQWVAAADDGKDLRIIRFNAPIKRLLEIVPEFPSQEGGTPDTLKIRTITIDRRKQAVSETTSEEPREPETTTLVIREPRTGRTTELTVPRAPRPATPQIEAPAGSAPLGVRAGPKEIGKNADGDTVFEDDNGVRSLSGGRFGSNRITEPVRIIPSREGVRTAVDTTQRDARFKTQEESQEQAQPPIEDARGAPTEESPSAESDVQRIARGFAAAFARGESFATIVEARKLAASILGREVKPGTAEAKLADEAIELGAVLRAKQIVAAGGSPKAIYEKLVELYARTPRLGTRTSTSVAEQAYSTPLPLAYLAARAADISRTDTVYEPSAGNGALLLTATEANVTANELNADRAANLRATMPDATVETEDASQWKPGGYFDVVIGNPPFGVVKDDQGRSRRFQVNEEYDTAEIDHAISIKALESMKDDGSAVLIVGSVAKTARSEDARSDAYNAKAKREFYLTLYRDYNVVDHFTVAGELYEKQGAGWPVDVIVIRGRGQSAKPVPAVSPPRLYASWESLAEVLDAQYRQSEAPVRTAVRADTRIERGPEGRDGADRGGSRASRPDRREEPAAAGQPADVRDGRVDRESGGQRPPDAPARQPQETAGSAGTERRPRASAVVAEGTRQVPYKPASGAPAMGTLVPVNMQTSTQDALDSLTARVGGVEQFIADRLDYKPEELGEYFGAEQLDALALGLDNLERGAGFIIGDQTGIGKGRVVAAVIRYAIRAGRTPIFITEKPNLYGDMYRDLTDIGIQKMLKREPKILMTNAAQSVPLDDDGERVLKTGAAGAHNRLLDDLASEGTLGTQYDMVFSTYSQMQTVKGDATSRMRFLETMANGGIVIFDESHNAGGTAPQREGKKPVMNRSTFARTLSRVAHGVFYSSATYAKRPDVMDLYASTDMRLAVSDPSKLGEAIAKGGVPMQQVVASMLAGAGQYVRRERSFDGIVYNAPIVNVDRTTYANYSRALAGIQAFSETYIPEATKRLDKELKAQGKSISPDGSTGGAGAKSTSFTSIMHNLIDQMLLSITADASAERAISALKAGEKPVITVANTMGSFIEDYVDGMGVNPGDKVAIDFNTLLLRYLERTRWVSMRKPFSKGPGEKFYIDDGILGERGVAQYEAAQELIRGMDFSRLPVSPIDHIKSRLEQAGYKVGEITGRSHTLDYRKGGPFYKIRSTRETSIRGRRETISKFNRGDIDAMIINQAGSTGLSLHASEKFKDQKKRRMILAQAEKNIDTHMQMLGRVNRTGQVVLPEYDQLVADVPAIKRPAAVLSKKMASLNANTTAARGHALKAENVPDFMNEYGDLIAARIMLDNPETHLALGEPLGEPDGDGYDTEDAARKVTGRIPLLPIEQQEALYEQLESEYEELIRQKEAAGESTLEAKTLDLDAQVKTRTQVIAPQGGGSPFADGVYVEEAVVKRLGKPHSTEEVLGFIADELKLDRAAFSADNMEPAVQAGRQAAQAVYREAIDRMRAYRAETVDTIESPEARAAASARMDGMVTRFQDVMRVTTVGQSVRLQTVSGIYYGVVIKVEQKGQPKNPLALGSWKVTLAMADSSKRLTLPMSQLEAAQQVGDVSATRAGIMVEKNILSDLTTIKAFDVLQTQTRENRTIITGNLLAGFEHVGQRGNIVNFTDAEGGVRQGILMPRGFNYAKSQADLPVPLRTAEQVLEFIGTGEPAQSTDSAVVIAEHGDGIRIAVMQSKSSGGQYYLNKAVLAAVGKDFVSVGGTMRADITRGQAHGAIEALRRAGASFQATKNLGAARKIAGTVAPPQEPEREADESFSIGDLGFFSGLTNAAAALKQERGTGEQMLAMLRKTPGVKEDELEWTGLADYLKARPTVTKTDILRFLDENGVKVEEVTIGDGAITPDERLVSDLTVRIDAAGYTVRINDNGELDAVHRRSDAEDFIFDADANAFVPEIEDADVAPIEAAVVDLLRQLGEASDRLANADDQGEETAARFEQYTLPGGENYREVLLTLPDVRAAWVKARADADAAQQEAFRLMSEKGFSHPDTKAAIARQNELNAAARKLADAPLFRSSHFSQENILAHVRLKDRTTPDGKRVLFVEEIQSDWAQQGRKRGFKSAPPPELQAALDKYLPGVPLERVSGRLIEEAGAPQDLVLKITDFVTKVGLTPRAPFVESTDAWAGLAIKRVIRMAAEGGYDAVAWTTGEQQAERYDLSKQIDRIEYVAKADGTFDVYPYPRGYSGATENLVKRAATADEVADYLGKDIADQMVAQRGERDGSVRTLRGLDLKIGGEGMLAFYDNIVPKLVNGFLKKLGGGKAEAVTLSTDGMTDGQFERIPMSSLNEDGQMVQPGFAITPELRERAGQGLPLFSLTPTARTKLDATMADLKKRLAKVGIADRVVLKLEAVITNKSGAVQSGARGRYYARTIEIAMYTTGKMRTLNHEIVHALKDLGVIRDAEWRILTKTVLEDAPLMKMVRAKYEPLGLSEAKIIEEAIAEKFAYWTQGTYKPKGWVQSAFQRIRDFLEALGNAWRGQGFQSANDILERIDSGEIGRRPSYGRGGFKQKAAAFEVEEEEEWKTPEYLASQAALKAAFDKVQAQAEELKNIANSPPAVDELRRQKRRRFEAEGKRLDEAMAAGRARTDRLLAELARDRQQRDALERQRKAAERRQQIKAVPDDEAGNDDAFSLEDRPKFNSRAAAAVQRGEVPKFASAETEKRWQQARKGIGGVETWRDKLRARADEIRNGFTRHWINLPNETRFANAMQQLRKLEAAPQATKEETLRTIRTITEGMSKDDLELFTRKAVLDDLSFEVESEHQLPFGLTPAAVATELEKLDAALAGRPDLLQKLELRSALSKKIANDMVRWGILHKEQLKNPAYYRHQVLEYARLELAASRAKGTGRRLRTPHWARRMGSTLDINANLLEVEFEWMQKALMQIEAAKTIDWFKRSDYNVREQVVSNARAHNDRQVSKLLELDAARNGFTKNGRQTSPLNEEWMGFKQRIAYGMKLIRDALDAGLIAEVPAEFQRVANDIQSEASGEHSIFPFLAWILDNNKPGSMGAAMSFKAINQRKAWMRERLGERYADPMQLDNLVKRGFAPEGYATWQPDEGLLMFMAKTIPENVMDRMLARIADTAAGPVSAEEMRGAFESVRSMLAVGGPKYQMVLPEELAATLSNLKDEETDGMFDAVAAGPVRAWKIWTLINPRRFLKYNLNNLSGDLDAIIAGNPRTLKKLPQAIRELRAVMLKGETPSPRYREAVERGVFDSGLTVQEIPDIKYLSEFEHLSDQGVADTLAAPIRKTWGALRRYTQFRENWMRYAAYLDYVERLEAGESMRSIGYGASHRAMVDAVDDTKDRAALLARDLVGDYGAISHFGKSLRRKVIPFWSWTEINMKRYWRLAANAWDQGLVQGFRATGMVGATLGLRTTAYLGMRMFVVYAAVQLWNNLVHGDDEDELSPEERARMHLILGRDANGEVVTLRLQGALSDVLAWFGFNEAVGMLSEVEKGRASYTDVLTAMAKAPVNKLASGLTPLITAPMEFASGEKLWPDVFNTRSIRDPWRNVAQLWSLEHEYDLIFDRPTRGYGRSWTEAAVYRRDPGENAYNRIKGMAYDWERRVRGESGGGSYESPRSKALYEWRQAKKFGDSEAESAALRKLRELGVRNESLQRSLRAAHPLGSIAIKDRSAFLKTLTKEERTTLEQAVAWYNETYRD